MRLFPPSSSSSFSSFLLLFTTTTTTITTLAGLAVGSAADFVSCGGDGLESFSQPLCDPMHLISTLDRYFITQLLTKCKEETGYKLVMFYTLSSSSSSSSSSSTHESIETTTTTTDTTNTTTDITTTAPDDDGGGDEEEDMRRLTQLVVTANNLTDSSSPVILLLGVHDQLQMSAWWSDSLCRALKPGDTEAAQRRANTILDQHHFAATLAHAAYDMCESAREGGKRTTTKAIVLTVLWGVFVFIFIFLLVAIAVILIRARHIALSEAGIKDSNERGSKQTGSLPYPITRTSVLQDFNVASFTASGHVLLGSTDITAVPPSDCSSTDNLLDD